MLSDGSTEIRVEAAKALGAIDRPEFRAELLQLLYDQEPVVVRQSIAAIRNRLTGGEPTPIYLPTLISLLQNRRLKHEAREALVELWRGGGAGPDPLPQRPRRSVCGCAGPSRRPSPVSAGQQRRPPSSTA